MQPWQILASRPLLDRRPWLSVWEEDVQLPDGTVIHGYLRARARDYAMVFALLPDGMAPLVRQYKHGPGRSCYDLPAGYLEGPDEAPLAAAQRELHEETGLVAGRWQSLGHLVIDTNRGEDRAHIFLAMDVRREGAPHLDPTETLEVSYHTPEMLRDMVLRGRIDSMASVAGILLAMDFITRTGSVGDRPERVARSETGQSGWLGRRPARAGSERFGSGLSGLGFYAGPMAWISAPWLAIQT